jgi:indolepyruvate ferredoxin oxidoreductase, alpha subunit
MTHHRGQEERDAMSTTLTGADALAQGVIAAGVSLVTGYAGAPATSVVTSLLKHSAEETLRVEWTSNEKVAVEMAFGASVAGSRSLLCVKSVGLNIALDPLMAMNLTGCNAGLVLLVGDDPGGWGSQNEQDTRSLALAAKLPVLEPVSVPEGREAVIEAFHLSEEFSLPVIVRFTSPFVAGKVTSESGQVFEPASGASEKRPFNRHVVLPVDVVPFHHRLHQKLKTIETRFEKSPFNHEQGEGPYGVIAAGYTFSKMMDVIKAPVMEQLRVFGLGTFFPMPAASLSAFLKKVKGVLVLEETDPLVERRVRSLAQEQGLTLPVCGRDTSHLPYAGELFGTHIAAALNRFRPDLSIPEEGERSRSMISRQSLCEGCPYIPTFDALLEALSKTGGRDHAVIVGEPGCMVRGQLPPYELLDVKTSLGSSIGMATGIALTLAKHHEKKRVVALCGDSSFLHSDLNALLDASRVGVSMLVLILDNGTTALSGGQPHPASPRDARGKSRPAVDMAALARASGVRNVETIAVDAIDRLKSSIESGLKAEGVSVIIASGPCPRYEK